ncbi:hypothetical protein DFR26_0278 [Paraperlucidibaca baekdonensis]|uniref:Uncharacterized protein n=1 Tax=Paraperlucidibaca baekdonensis TaxID=748120 RepID=A0A3E0H8M4_9GAMM|nr:hypothetical protein [Paraperlucidibaca baekdonensis]REH40079.1 hypothetical protein DFR26_0278 [Paraperlucidibaca baekdonensis]
MSFLTRVEAIKDLIQEAVDKGATSVEQIHQAIASMPLDALAKRGLLEDKAESVKQSHADTIGTVYDAIRRVNREVGDLATGLIESVEDQIATQKNINKKD